MATEPTIIVVRPELQQLAEDAAIAASPAGGAGTFIPGVPLRAAGDATNRIRAYWCRWEMLPASPGVRAQRATFAKHLGGPVSILSATEAPDLARDRWMFDAAPGQWTHPKVLAALGLDTLASEDG